MEMPKNGQALGRDKSIRFTINNVQPRNLSTTTKTLWQRNYILSMVIKFGVPDSSSACTKINYLKFVLPQMIYQNKKVKLN